jgi:hypothetical protein
MNARPFAEGGRAYAGFGTINGCHPGAQHVCGWCWYRWPVANYYYRWPIRLKWSARPSSQWFSWHGWEIGRDRLWRTCYGWTFHLGRLKVMFGPDWRVRRSVDRLACPRCDTVAWERP